MGWEVLDTSQLLHFWPIIFFICLKGQWCHKLEVTIQLQMQIPASRKIALTVLSFDLFSCSELRFKQVAGREVSEGAGIAEQQSEILQSC